MRAVILTLSCLCISLSSMVHDHSHKQEKTKKVSATTIRHFMKDSGASRKEINKVKFQFTADAVEII